MGVDFGGRRKVPNPAATSLEPLRITIAEYRRALALSQELAEIGEVELHDGTGVWEVCLHGSKADRVVVKALDAVRQSLAGDLDASAEIVLDGRRYRMKGE
jgi:hypothetical protein